MVYYAAMARTGHSHSATQRRVKSTSRHPNPTTAKYRHSAYWYAYHNGWTHSEASTNAWKFIDVHSFRPRIENFRSGWRDWRGPWSRKRDASEWDGRMWMKWRNSPRQLDSDFNPFALGVFIAMDIGVAMRDVAKKVADPAERTRVRLELMRDLRIVRRPFYYARETERRRKLAAERRKIRRRSTTAPMPTASEIMAAWEARKESREAMVRLGGMLHDLECYVDNCLKFDERGDVVGRNGGIRGWLRENLPELSPKYKTLMRYKALAVRLRQASGAKDPTPTSTLLDEPRCEVVADVVGREDPVFDHIFTDLEYILSPRTALMDAGRRSEKSKCPTENENSLRKNNRRTALALDIRNGRRRRA